MGKKNNIENFTDAFVPLADQTLDNNEYAGNAFQTRQNNPHKGNVPVEYVRGTMIQSPAPDDFLQKTGVEKPQKPKIINPEKNYTTDHIFDPLPMRKNKNPNEFDNMAYLDKPLVRQYRQIRVSECDRSLDHVMRCKPCRLRIMKRYGSKEKETNSNLLFARLLKLLSEKDVLVLLLLFLLVVITVNAISSGK
jgi:hypothetical protein